MSGLPTAIFTAFRFSLQGILPFRFQPSAFKFLLPRLGQRLRDVPAFLVVDVGGFGAGGLEEDRFLSDAGIGRDEAVSRKDVEVRVFLKPWLQILRADEIVGVVIHRRSVGAVEAGLEFVHGEEAVVCAGGDAGLVGFDRCADGPGGKQRVGGVGHEVGVCCHILEIVGDDEIHADEVAANFRFTVADEDAIGIDEAFLRENVAGIGVDHDAVDLLDLEQGVEDPAEERLAGEVAEILSGDARAVRFHG